MTLLMIMQQETSALIPTDTVASTLEGEPFMFTRRRTRSRTVPTTDAGLGPPGDPALEWALWAPAGARCVVRARGGRQRLGRGSVAPPWATEGVTSA